MSDSTDHPHRVVVVGGGFAGLRAVRGLRRAAVDVTLVDRQNVHVFQPLSYQVATGALSATEIAAPLRAVLRRQANARVVLGEVTGFDLARRAVAVDHLPTGRGTTIPYDTLVVAAGSRYDYFGHDEWGRRAPELKTLDGALEVRDRLLRAFEAAELEDDPARRRAWLTLGVAGAGPTGVELAGQIAELARETLRRDFRGADTASAQVLLVDAADRVLPQFPEPLSHTARRSLRELGVTPLLSHALVDLEADDVVLRSPSGRPVRVAARTVVWAAGVRAVPLAETLARAAGVPVDRTGRVHVRPDLTVAGHPEVLALGDMVAVERSDGAAAGLPAVAPVAIAQGAHAARLIRDRLAGRASEPFRYVHRGDVATIGRGRAVADIGGLRLTGRPARALWLGIHLAQLSGVQNRVLVALRWTVGVTTRRRGARLIRSAA